MTYDQLPSGVALAYTGRPLSGGGFGLGVGVREGEFWWVGDSGTSFVVNIEKRLIAILLTQQTDQFRNYLALLRRLARAVVVPQ